MFVPGSELENLANSGMNVNKFLASVLDYISDDSNGSSGGTGLEDARSVLGPLTIEWKSITSLVNALGRSLLGYLEERGESELSTIYRGLIRAQSQLFDTYLEEERNRREDVWRHQKEIDRFPDTIATTLDPATLMKEGMARLKLLTGAKEACFFKVEPEGKLVHQIEEGLTGDESRELKISGEAARRIIEEGEPYCEEAERARFCVKGLKPDAQYVLLVPLVVRGRTTAAALLCGGNGSSFKPESMEIAASFASRLAVAMENAELHSREQRKIKETVALLEIARAINSTLDIQEILDKMVQMTVDLCGVVMCVVYLLDEERGRFVPGAYYGFIEDALWEEERDQGIGIYALGQEYLSTLRGGDPVIIPSEQDNLFLPPELMYEHGVDMVLMFPLSSRERMTGIFAIFYPKKPEDLEQSEIEVVRAIAAQASLAIENAALYEDIERSYFSTVSALAKAIEVKDPYTHGHSERVTEYALLIAEAMRLDERERQKLKYAATLHDIGKIGIAGRVLNKPGSLTDEEYTHVKTHPLLGDSIVEPVEFLQGPRPIILHHHERFDGTGYPDGLKGRRIPLCARILAVADAFEAMRSDRPYRRALPLEIAKTELMKNSGSQFDPQVVETFLHILECHEGDPVNG
ncbi:MAG: hypothetical protein A2Y75_04730 [Candidatus Solincola sediminis]|uniref:HD-GYP domain-containing protein n=1 Tax=Candidatus Solincola sediminis TaxID=1797199 RepID=A0A1F2WGN9_9ACTN|nr:MAG: hypothetical protein A2Y75_04730 [Candidatus Solincola sediminis]